MEKLSEAVSHFGCHLLREVDCTKMNAYFSDDSNDCHYIMDKFLNELLVPDVEVRSVDTDLEQAAMDLAGIGAMEEQEKADKIPRCDTWEWCDACDTDTDTSMDTESYASFECSKRSVRGNLYI